MSFIVPRKSLTSCIPPSLLPTGPQPDTGWIITTSQREPWNDTDIISRKKHSALVLFVCLFCQTRQRCSGVRPKDIQTDGTLGRTSASRLWFMLLSGRSFRRTHPDSSAAVRSAMPNQEEKRNLLDWLDSLVDYWHILNMPHLEDWKYFVPASCGRRRWAAE